MDRTDRKNLIEILPNYLGKEVYTQDKSTQIRPWLVRENILASSPMAANKQAISLLENGVTALGFQMQDAWVNALTLEWLLKGIDLNTIEIHFSCCLSRAIPMLQALNSYCEKYNIDKKNLKGSIDYVPLKREIVRGKVTPDWHKEGRLVLEAAKAFPHLRVLMISSYYFSNAGATPALELGLALSWAFDLVTSMRDEGFPLEYIIPRIQFNFGIGSNFFQEIAKFRAARWLWSEIVKQIGGETIEDYPMCQYAQNSQWNITRYDPYSNLLRIQSEAISAILGGVNILYLSPFDPFSNTTSDSSLRLAQSPQIHLLAECQLYRLNDPCGASDSMEIETANLIKEVKTILLEIESQGGYAVALQKGYIQKKVNLLNKERQEAICLGKEVLIGSNKSPNLSHKNGEAGDDHKHSHHCSIDHSREEDVEGLDFSRGSSRLEAEILSTERA